MPFALLFSLCAVAYAAAGVGASLLSYHLWGLVLGGEPNPDDFLEWYGPHAFAVLLAPVHVLSLLMGFLCYREGLLVNLPKDHENPRADELKELLAQRRALFGVHGPNAFAARTRLSENIVELREWRKKLERESGDRRTTGILSDRTR